MRIISGDYGGRRLVAVPGMKTRPTTDKVKEDLFNIIGPYFAGGVSLDLFAGSGGLSIEGVSRGIDHAYLVDRQYQAIKTIEKNISVTKHEDKFSVMKMDAVRALHRLAAEERCFDLVYLDPPYAKQQITKNMALMVDLGLLNNDARIVAETDQNAHLPVDIPHFTQIRQQSYGITVLTIYQYEKKE